MTAVSFGINRGVGGFKQTDVTVGTGAPGNSNDFELRFQVLDANSKNINDLDIVMALKAFIRWVETNGPSLITITQQPSGPPN